MTDIIYEPSKTQTELTIMGHCNAGRINGIDLCCCAVSMLVCTMLDSLGRLKLKGFLHSYGGGWCHVRFSNSGKDFKKALVIIETMLHGFKLLEKKYPSNVAISIKKGVI